MTLQLPISSSAFTDIARQAKAAVEATGVRFHTLAELERAEQQGIFDDVFTYEDKQKAFLICLETLRRLMQQYPHVPWGLERYDGASGVEYKGVKYSFDIILPGPDGPSVDMLIKGVEPACQPDLDPAHIPNWRRDYARITFDSAPTPLPEPPPSVPTPGTPVPNPGTPPSVPPPSHVCPDYSDELDAMVNAIASLQASFNARFDAADAKFDEAMQGEYTARILGQTVTFKRKT